MNKHLVFVYGTLRRGGANAMTRIFPNSKFIAEARVNGSLFDLGAYPGLLTNKSSSPVTGEVFEVDDATLGELDEFETSSNYRRKQIEVAMGARESLCWVYEPSPELCSNRTLISSGDWIEHAKSKSESAGDTLSDKINNGS